MNLSPRNIRVPCLKAALAVLLVFALSFGVVKSTVAFAFDGGVLCGDIALDNDGTDDPELFLLKVNPIHLQVLKSHLDTIVDDARFRSLSQPPATPPPISA